MSSNVKWYLAAGKDGRSGKIITQEEAEKLSLHEKIGHLYTLGSALREGLINADLSEAGDVNDLTFWIKEELDIHGNIIPGGPRKYLNKLADAPAPKLGGNKLRDLVQAKRKRASLTTNNS